MRKFIQFLKSIFLEIAFLVVIVSIFILTLSQFKSFLPENDLITGLAILIPTIIFILYFIFSNTKYKSVSAAILRYSLVVEKGKGWKIVLSNIIILFFIGVYFYLYTQDSMKVLFNLTQVLLFIEVFSCLIPKIGTRMSFYLLKIEWIDEKKTPKKKKKPIDKIMI